jgi:hypothetical protein
MSHTYTITRAYYTGPLDDPICVVYGSVDGGNDFPPIYPYYSVVMRASSAGGVAGVQELLGALLLNREQCGIPPFPTIPTPPISNYPPPTLPEGNTPVVFITALVGSWTA